MIVYDGLKSDFLRSVRRRITPCMARFSGSEACFLHELQIKAEQHGADGNAEQHP